MKPKTTESEELQQLKEGIEVANHRLKLTSRRLFTFLFENNEFNYKKSSIKHLPTTKSVKQLLENLYDLERKLTLENNLQNIDEELALLKTKTMIEMLRETTLSLSNIEFNDVARPLNEEKLMPETENLFKTNKLIYNALLALELEEVSIAKRKYLEALRNYTELSKEEQKEVFEELTFLFNAIKYKKSFVKEPKREN